MKTIKKHDLKPVLNVEDIQKFLGIGRRQSYELVNSGQFRVVKIGQRIKVDRDVFLKWFEGDEAWSMMREISQKLQEKMLKSL